MKKKTLTCSQSCTPFLCSFMNHIETFPFNYSTNSDLYWHRWHSWSCRHRHCWCWRNRSWNCSVRPVESWNSYVPRGLLIEHQDWSNRCRAKLVQRPRHQPFLASGTPGTPSNPAHFNTDCQGLGSATPTELTWKNKKSKTSNLWGQVLPLYLKKRAWIFWVVLRSQGITYLSLRLKQTQSRNWETGAGCPSGKEIHKACVCVKSKFASTAAEAATPLLSTATSTAAITATISANM